MEHLSLESLKEPPSTSTNGLNSRRHTVSVQENFEPFPSKVPARTQAAIEKVAEMVNKMGGQIRTHIQDNGGPLSHPSHSLPVHVLILCFVDVMLDTYGYKSSAEDTKQFDLLAKQIFLEETGHESDDQPTIPLDNLIGHDQNGNLWIYASEQAKQYAESTQQTPPSSAPSTPSLAATKPAPGPPVRPKLKALKALTQLGEEEGGEGRISRAESEPAIPTQNKSGQLEDGYSYAKTLRLTSEQLVCPIMAGREVNLRNHCS